MAEHSKGPWIVGGDAMDLRPNMTVTIAFPSLAGGSRSMSERYEQRIANELLISAAPELLEACETLVAHQDYNCMACEEGYGCDFLCPVHLQSVGKARAAIAKAKGKKP